MNLTDTLFVIENFLGIETDSLLPFAEVDSIGGFHPDPSQRQWHIGAMFGVEGQTLHALIRSLQPENVVEIGSGTGCSANHIASALKANDKFGHLTTIDRGNTPHIPDDLKTYVTVIAGDGILWLEGQPDNSVDFIFEDADHSELMCYQIGELAKSKLRPGGVLVAHDAAHFAVGADVRAGFTRAGIEGRVYLTEPSDCGLLVWRKAALPEGARLMPDGNVFREYNQTEQDHQRIQNGNHVRGQELADSLADTEPVLQAQEDKPNPEELSDVQKGIKILTDALHDDESTEEKVEKLLATVNAPPKRKRKPARKAAKK